jgi:aspartate carbamoyltransferase catalytic subunit
MAIIHQAASSTTAHQKRDSLMANLLYGSDIVSMRDLSIDQIKQILELARQLKIKPASDLLKDKIIANCFFEPSTRTRLSFETAALRLAANVIGFANDESLSTKKGESLYDTIRVISDYADLVIIRHPNEGAARLAADVTTKPVINAGDGSNQHPTQTLIDLFTIQECQQRLDGLSVALVGDLKYGRTIHSFAEACALFDIRLYLVAPTLFAMPQQITDRLKRQGVRFSCHKTIEEIIHKIDIIYMTRLQKERFTRPDIQFEVHQPVLNTQLLEKAKSHLKILHPLPRNSELPHQIDKSGFAYYFEQAANGVYVRQALLTLLLNKALP